MVGVQVVEEGSVISDVPHRHRAAHVPVCGGGSGGLAVTSVGKGGRSEQQVQFL